MDERPIDAKRRRIVLRSLGLAGVCALGTAAGARSAAAKTAKSALLYQDHPHDGRRCADCKFFSPDGANPAVGTCAVVEGAIDRSGWCMAFSPAG